MREKRLAMDAQQEQIGLYALESAATLSGLPRGRIVRYVRIGLVRPSRQVGRRPMFSEDELVRLRRIRRLSDELGLNLAGVEVAMRLLDEIASLHAALEERAG